MTGLSGNKNQSLISAVSEDFIARLQVESIPDVIDAALFIHRLASKQELYAEPELWIVRKTAQQANPTFPA
jgi:hypothetical protein